MIHHMRRLHRSQRGITGLETAIILIAFVVVASVFAFTVLSAGVFSAEKGKEAIYAGLRQASSSMEVVGPLMVTGVAANTLDVADAAWTASASVTANTDATDRKEGTASATLAIDAAFATGLVAYKAVSPTVDMSSHYSARLWIKTDTNVASGVLSLVLDDTAACVSPLETLSLGELKSADGWKQVQVKLSSPSALTAVACVGLTAASDPAAPTLKIDLVEAPGEATQAHLVVANALGSEPIDMTTTSDADSDGLLSDEATKTHVMVASYSDQNQRIDDITWTKTTLGYDDGDNLLEPREKYRITVNLKAASPMPVDNTKFGIILRPPTGASLIVERTLPVVIKANMDLN